MKTLCISLISTLVFCTSCEKNDTTLPISSACIDAKIEMMRTANLAYTSVARYKINNEYCWLFDTGSAFDAPKYMLNVSCDTVCKWCRCSTIPTCQSDYNLNDSSAIIIWKY
jgi:hypothetical protein